MDREELKFFLFIAILLTGAIWLGLWDDRQWKEFSEKHHCQFDHQDPEQIVFVQTYFNGQMQTQPEFRPGPQYYKCDDGKVYRR